MPTTELRDLADGESTFVQGSGANPYELKNVGGLFSCSCPSWRNQSRPIEQRTCKHLKKLRGEAAEALRVGYAAAPPPRPSGPAPTPAPVMLAETYDPVVHDPTGWWYSEKFDGVRCYYDGGGRFFSRAGNEMAVPDFFKAGFPPYPLDGEIWMGRGKFHLTSALCRRGDKPDTWADLTFMAFDAPGVVGLFEERSARLRAHVEAHQPFHLRAVPQGVVLSRENLSILLAGVEEQGAEGLMIRRPGSPYTVGRTFDLLKVKSWKDAEATVIGYKRGTGANAGLTGSLHCEFADGKRFYVGTGLSAEDRRMPPPVGTVVGVKFKELNPSGVPREPSYIGVRDI